MADTDSGSGPAHTGQADTGQEDPERMDTERADTRPAAIGLVIVDDDPLVRTGLKLILGGAGDITVLAEAADGHEAERAVAAHRPDVVLMDIRMPHRDGLAATRTILQKQAASGALRAAKILVLTTFDADELVVEALRSGASGFLLKDTPPERLVGAVRAVASGEPMLSPSVTAQLMAHVAAGGSDARGGRERRARELLATLTDREREVAVAIGRGLSNAEIAEDLGMGLPTVKTHVSRLLAKLYAENRVQIALVVHDAGC